MAEHHGDTAFEMLGIVKAVCRFASCRDPHAGLWGLAITLATALFRFIREIGPFEEVGKADGGSRRLRDQAFVDGQARRGPPSCLPAFPPKSITHCPAATYTKIGLGACLPGWETEFTQSVSGGYARCVYGSVTVR